MINIEGFGIGVKLDGGVINHIKYIKEKSMLGGPVFNMDEDGNFIIEKNGKCARLESKNE
jgi:hypothetical protein